MAGRITEPGVVLRRLTFPPHHELEGYRPLDGTRGLFLIAGGSHNAYRGRVKLVDELKSPAGSESLGLDGL